MGTCGRRDSHYVLLLDHHHFLVPHTNFQTDWAKVPRGIGAQSDSPEVLYSTSPVPLIPREVLQCQQSKALFETVVFFLATRGQVFSESTGLSDLQIIYDPHSHPLRRDD